MENEKSAFDHMPDWFQEKTRSQIKKEMELENKTSSEQQTAIRTAMQKEAEKILGNDKSDDQDQSDKHIYI